MAGTVTLVCSESRLDIGAVLPQDAVRAESLQKAAAPDVALACKAKANVESAKAEVETCRHAAAEAGIAANQHPSPENEKARIQTQANLRSALTKLEGANRELEKINQRLAQLKDKFLGLTKSDKQPKPLAARLAKPLPPKEETTAPEMVQADTGREPVLREHRIERPKVSFRLSDGDRRGLKNSK